MLLSAKFYKKIVFQFTLVILAIVLFVNSASAQIDSQDSTGSKPTLLLKNDKIKLAPAEYFSKDTLFSPDSENAGEFKPGYPNNKYHSPFQDTVYKRAMRLHIPVSLRLSNDFKLFAEKRMLEKELEKGLPWQIALENLRIRPDILAPSPQELVHRQEMITNSFYVPFMPNMMGSGFVFDAREAAVFMGLAEDVSPILRFDLNYSEEVEVVIYSVQASVIATIFKGVRPAGSHKFVWNGRDDKGRPVDSGDYIGEIRIGNTRYVRKKITIP